jgi:hypothetical protein
VRTENFLLVAITAAKFGCRPSRLAGLDDPVLALDFDLAAAARLLEQERVAVGEVAPGLIPPSPPEGQRGDEVPRLREERW